MISQLHETIQTEGKCCYLICLVCWKNSYAFWHIRHVFIVVPNLHLIETICGWRVSRSVCAVSVINNFYVVFDSCV